MPSRRDFLKTAGLVTVGFSLAPGCGPTDRSDDGEANAEGGSQTAGDLPPSLRNEPEVDAWLQVMEDGRLRVYTGKIELGQGIRIAIAQVAAEEMNTSPDRVSVHLAETGVTPNERYTSASVSIEHSAQSVRHACATARRLLTERAAEAWGVDPADVTLTDATLSARNRSTTLPDLLGGDPIRYTVTEPADLTPASERTWIGTPVPRRDVEKMAVGEAVYVHDLRFDDVVHARIVRSPGPGARLQSLDAQSVESRFDEVDRVVVDGDFVGVLAATEYAADRAQQALSQAASWTDPDPLPAGEPLEAHLRSLPVETADVVSRGSAPSTSGERVRASYFRPYVMHASIGPSCAVAHYDGDRLRVWTHSQGVYPLRDTLAAMLDLPAEKIRVTGVPGSGCYGHNGADDVAAEAAVLAMQSPNKHVRLQWSRADEHGWEPYGSAMILDLEAALGSDGTIADWSVEVWSDTHSTRPGGNPGALLPARTTSDPQPLTSRGFLGGAHRNAVPVYSLPALNVRARFFDGPLRVSALRALGAHANVFAIEGFMDKLAERAGTDPLSFRRRHLSDERARAVLDAVAEPAEAARTGTGEAVGYGVAQYRNSAAYCAVAARASGSDPSTARITHLWGAIDAGETINPDGLRNQLEGGMIQATSWALHEAVQFDDRRVTSLDWNSYPILRFDEVPEVEARVIDRPDQPPVGAGEAAQGPATAAVVNALSAATGQRIRSLPVR